MLRTSLTKKRGKLSAKEVPRTPTRADKKSNSRTTALLNGSSDKKKGKQPPTPESSESSSDSDNDGEFEVEAILGRKVNREGKVFYRIKWKNFDLRYATWEPEENVSNAPKLIETYEKTLKADGNDEKADKRGKQPKDLLRKRGLDELAGRKKGGAQKTTNRKKMMESEDEEEEEEDFYDDETDEEEAEDEEEDQEEQEEDQEEESESDEEGSDEEEEKIAQKGKKAVVVNPVAAKKVTKKLKTETVSAVPVKEISKEIPKEKKKPEPVPVVSNETKRKSVGKLRIQEEPEEAPPVVQQKEMQIEPVQEEKKDVIQEEKPAPVEITRVAMQEEIEEKQSIPSKKNSLVTEPIVPIQQEEPKATTPADPEVIKNMILEEESPEKAAPAAAVSKPDNTTTIKPAAVSQPTKPSRDDADHATNVLRELGRTSSAFKINLEAKSDYNNLLLTRNNSGFQQSGSAFNSSKTSAIPSQKDSKPAANDVAPVNPNTNSANPLLGLLDSKGSTAGPSALSLPFGANPLLNNPLLYGGAAGMNRPLDDEEARKNQIVFQGYLQISNYMLPQNNPMAAMNNNRMRNMLGANPFAAMNPLHNPFLPNTSSFPGFYGMPNPLLAANPMFPAMGMAPGFPNLFGPMAGLAGNASGMRNNMMFNEMMKSGLSPSSLGLTPTGNSGKSDKGGKEIIILDDKKEKGDEKGKKKEVAEKK